jgi:LPS-assembly lipoprotein
MSGLSRLAGTRMNVSQSFVVFALVGMLSACGFQLRGVGTLPPELQSIDLQADSLSVSQVNLLNQNLQQAGASLSDDGSTDRVRLAVAIKSLPDRNLANSVGANAVVVRVSRELTYSLTSKAGERLVNQKNISRQVDLTLDNNNPIGIEFEKENATASLDRELIYQLILLLEQY